MRRGLVSCVAGWGVALSPVPAIAGLEPAAQIAATCAACHRLDGRGSGTPTIVGLNADRLVAVMHAFQSNETPNPIMHAVSLSLSDDEIATVARYLAAPGTDAKPP